ncbi:MAG TPA: hypothetical protein P5307_24515 [Pirellulaceae bacterium]|nr:hypothetical protein [Planctomycetaceae bacterium]HRX82262.1 hypothetical protein [Pirellulaceae bacterium]
MKFPPFLVRQHWLTKDEYMLLNWRSVKSIRGTTSRDGFLEPSIREQEVELLDEVRPIPFGDILKADSEIIERVLLRSDCKDFDDLVKRWHDWHVENCQPISDFGLSPAEPKPFGKRLYEQAEEKRLCGNFVANSIVHDGDHIVIPEGTSAFWVALCCLGRRKKLRVISSNGALIRELLENPVLRSNAIGVSVIGGEMDSDLGGCGRGFIGESTKVAYEEAIQRKPGATVVISSVNGLIADEGPFAPCPVAGFTRHAVLMHALESNVRTVVFAVDYTKMTRKTRKEYGDPIFSDKANWRGIVDRYKERIKVVVTPPPDIRENEAVTSVRPKDRVIRGNGYSPSIVEYLQEAAALDSMLETSDGVTSFIEALPIRPDAYAQL